jgi:hypothetical protein
MPSYHASIQQVLAPYHARSCPMPLRPYIDETAGNLTKTCAILAESHMMRSSTFTPKVLAFRLLHFDFLLVGTTHYISEVV